MVKQSNASRFSTLKVFNFSSGSSSKSVHGGDTYQDDTAPPPPPPKDRYYLYNRSMSSLSPDSFSMPSTPLSPGFSSNSSTKRPSPVPSQSTADLHEFGTNGYGNGYGSASPITSPSNPAPPPLNTKKSFFGRMASKSRRSPRSATPKGTPTEVRPEGGEDSGISMPWNFQHNMHVDEGLSGLPPSWTTSLSSAGFTDEEIAAIQARKLANRSPSASSQYQYLYNDRPASPATTIGTGAGLPFLANPTPRTTSLPRQHPDNASISSSVYKQQTGASNSTSPRFPPPPPLQVPNNAPPLPNAIPQRIQPSRKPSNSDAISVYTSHTTASSSFDHPEAQYVYINSRNELTSHAPSDSSFSNSRSQSPVSSGTGEGVSVIINGGGAVVGPNGVVLPVDKRPRTPPRRTFRVVNESPGMMSPPPAYKSPAAGSVFAQLAAGGSEKAGLPSSSSSSEPPPPAIDDAEEKAAEKDDLGKPKGGAKRLTALPPRLSLHEASDLSSWSESLFSAIPSAAGSASGAGSHQLRTPTSATSASSLSAPKPHASTSSSTPPVSISPSYRPPQPQRPIPSLPKPPSGVKDLEVIPHALDAPSDGTGPTTPLWNEIMGLVQQQETTSPSTPVDSPPLTPALNDMHSPTIPITPVPYGHMRQHQHADDDYEDDDGYLGLDPGNSNRDSNMSTATVTSATIVRNASLATRAIANVVDRVPPSRKQQGQAVERIAVAEVSAFEEEDDDEEDEEEEELLFPPTPSPIQSTFPVDDTTARNPSRHYKTASMVSRSLSPALTSPPPAPGSPHSSYFSESSSSGTGSDSRTSLSRPDSRGTASDEAEKLPQLPPKSPELAYLLQTSPSNSPLPSPAGSSFGEQTITLSARDTFGEPSPLRVKTLTIDEDGVPLRRPSIVLNGVDIEDREDAMTETMSPLSPRFLSPSITPGITSQSPKRYRDWISDVLAPLEEFIDQVIDPRDYFKDLQEIAEAESGSVYAARLYKPEVFGLPSGTSYVAIKNVPILPSGSPKLLDLRKELKLTRGVSHENVLTMDTLYVDLVEDAVWIRMELMERSLADVVGLVADGLMVQERMIARFASDVLRALEYLQKQGIAHRDVRSDNLLLNKDGVLKIADFSNAVQVTPQTPECLGAAGVIYWQAPEMRLNKPYNALKVDVWSLGATVWETAQSEPPFADVQDPRQIGDRWPTLSQPEIYSRSFHEFLRLCSEPSSSRPGPSELLNTPFIRNACGRPVNVQLLSQCRAIEETMLERENDS